LGVNAGLTMPFTDLNYKEGLPDVNNKRKLLMAPTFGGSLDYYFTPFLNAGVEYNMVSLKEGPDMHDREYTSDFSSIEIRAGVSLGQFVDYQYNDILYALRGLNLSLGYGIISGKNTAEKKHAADIGKDKFENVSALPITIGYNFVFYNQYDEQKVLLGLNLKTVFTNSDDINGYNDDPNQGFKNKAKDFYSTFGISLKYMFGPRSLYY